MLKDEQSIEQLKKTLTELEEKICSLEKENTALKEINQRYLQLTQAARGFVWEFNAEGIYTYISPEVLEITGYTPNELIGAKAEDVMVNALVDNDIDYFKKLVASGGFYNKKIKVKHKNKREITLAASGNAFFNNKNEYMGVRGVLIDITTQQEIEDGQKDSLERIKTLTNAMPGGVYFKDSEGRWLEVNEAGLKTFDLIGFEYYGKTSIEIAEHKPFYAKALRASGISDNKAWETKSTFKAIEKIPTLDGREQIIEFTKIPLFNSDGTKKALVVVGHDITELKMAESKSKENEMYYRILFESVPMAVITADLQGNIIECNTATLELLGSPSFEETKKINLLTFPPLIEMGFSSDIKECIKSKKIIQKEDFYISKWGKAIYFSEHIVPIIHDSNVSNVIIIVEDISKRKAAELELLNQKILFETIFNSIPDSVIITNRERRIIYSNKASEKIFGLTQDELLGKSTEILYANKQTFQNQGKVRFEEDAVLQDIEEQNKLYISNYKHKSGRVFPGETIGVKLYDKENKWIGNVGIMRDVSEREKFTNELIKAKEQAEESDRLKSAFLANMSHEIRTPMNGIVGFTDILLSADFDGDQKQKYLNLIQSSSIRLLHLINDIIDISKIEAGEIIYSESKVSIDKLLTGVYDFFKPKTELKQLEFILENKLEKNTVILSDLTKLEQILVNLVSNAVKFTDSGKIRIGCTQKGNFLEFYVIDTGIGIPKSKQKIIFDRFRQIDTNLKKVPSGTGLGLSLSKSFVEFLGGEINLISETNKGAAFHFTIPYKPTEANEFAYETGDFSSATWEGSTILIVEDDETNYYYLKEVLETTYADLIWAKTGLEAIEFCKTKPKINLVLMNIKMPDLNGWQATKEIKKIRKNLPIIAQTAFAMSNDKEKAGEAGCDSFISKPIRKSTLLKEIHHFLG